jgi:hypothetical protein
MIFFKSCVILEDQAPVSRDRVALQGRGVLSGVANLVAAANRRGSLKFTYARKIYLGSCFFFHYVLETLSIKRCTRSHK